MTEKLSELTTNPNLSADDLLYVVDDALGTPHSYKATIAAVLGLYDVSGLVPYSGATGNVNLGTNALACGGITVSHGIYAGATTQGLAFKTTDNVSTGYIGFRGSSWNQVGLWGPSQSLVSNPAIAVSGASVFLAGSFNHMGSSFSFVNRSDLGINPGFVISGGGGSMPSMRIAGYSGQSTPYLQIRSNSGSDEFSVFPGGVITGASNVLQQRNGLSAQQFELFGQYTSATSFENLILKTTASAHQIGSGKGSGGGNNLPVQIGHFDAAGTFTSGLSVTTTGAATFSSSLNMTSGDNGIIVGGNLRLWSIGGASLIWRNSTNTANRWDVSGTGSMTAAGDVTFVPSLSRTLSTNGQFSIEMTSNTNGNLVYRGSDGTTRRMGMNFDSTAVSYVPYTGATGAVDLGANGLTCGAITASDRVTCTRININVTNAYVDWGNGSLFFYRGGSIRASVSDEGVYSAASKGLGFRNQGSGVLQAEFVGAGDNRIAQRNGLNAQQFELFGQYTSATSFENLILKTTAAAHQIGSGKGSGGGNNQPVQIGHFDAAGAFTSGLSVATDGTLVAGGLTINPGNGALTFNQTFGITMATSNAFIIRHGHGDGTWVRTTTGTISTLSPAGYGAFGLINTSNLVGAYFAIPVAGTLAIRNAAHGDAALMCGAITTSGQITQQPPSSVTLASNGQFSIEMTSNTAGNLVYRGSDGTTRRMALTFT